jgi:leader peptidase (prepilin peptidase) / N-methyltransferase
MHLFIVAAAALLGLLVGSFLNVVIWRVPRGESVVSPRSRCPQCGHEIRGRDNVPVVSWLLLHARCRDCGAHVSARYPLVELATAVLFGLLAWHFGLHVVLIAFLYLGAVAIALAAIDIDLHKLPDALTLPSYPVAAVLLTAGALAAHEPFDLVRTAIGGVALFAFYAVLWFVYPRGMGLGDVKLAGVLGMYLGYLGWGTLAVGAFLGFALGAVVGVSLMATGRATRKSKIPFGPFMLSGALVAVFVGARLAHAYVSITRG